MRNQFRFLSGGLRYAATTGYYLTALQAGLMRPLRVYDCECCAFDDYSNVVDTNLSWYRLNSWFSLRFTDALYAQS